ncbi:divalent cation transporter [Teredinibacter turnerae]|uniref:ZIP family metal transporter n=1 Tax=Teredinibacter turnerae TaxID=2426 RepID=UPI00036567E1|nr:divalent cation transporter [Teredinibacter turnerae]
MESLHFVIISSLLAGLSMPLGGIIASVERIQPNWLEQEFRHGIIAFGGGALLSAVALVLVPESLDHVGMSMAASMLILGGVAFAFMDYFLAKKQTPAGQLLAMLSDFIPEAMALGAAFATGNGGGLLLAALIALQNLPEGFNAYREIKSNSHVSSIKLILGFAALALLGPLAGSAGYFWLAQQQHLLAAIMMFAAGGILYSVFEDIAPQARLENHWSPPLGAVLGFTLGVLGHYLTSAG